jgi:hypothetical protein
MSALPERPSIYRRAGPWQLALCRLCKLPYSDEQRAEILSDLSPEAIGELEDRGWTCESVAAALLPGSGGQPWTACQVRYHRGALGLGKAWRQRREWSSLYAIRLQCAMAFASELGWGHIVGRSLDLTEALGEDPQESGRLTRAAKQLGPGWTETRVRAWVREPWDVLWPTEALVLTCLALQAPQTLSQLSTSAEVLVRDRKLHVPGHRSGRPSRPQSAERMDRLIARVLVRPGPSIRVKRVGRPARSYCLAEGLHPYMVPTGQGARPRSVEQLG